MGETLRSCNGEHVKSHATNNYDSIAKRNRLIQQCKVDEASTGDDFMMTNEMTSTTDNDSSDDNNDDDDDRCTTDDGHTTTIHWQWDHLGKEYTQCDSGAISPDGCTGLTSKQPAGKGKSLSSLIETGTAQRSREGMIRSTQADLILVQHLPTTTTTTSPTTNTTDTKYTNTNQHTSTGGGRGIYVEAEGDLPT